MKIKMGMKVILTNLITIVIFIAVCIVLFITMGQLKENQYWVSHTYEVISEGEEILSYMVDQETGMRGFLATGNENYLEPYINGKKGFSKLMAELQKTVSDNPVQVERLQKIEQAASDWDEKAASVFIELRREIISHDTLNSKVMSRMNDGIGKLKMDTFRAAISAYERNPIADEILTDMVNMETGLRGYIAASDEQFLEPYNNGKSDIVTHLAQLNIPRITILANDWIDNYSELQLNDTREALIFRDIKDLNDEMSKNIGKTYMDGIRADINDFVGMESNLLVTRNETADRQRTTANLIILFGSIIASAVAIILSLIVTKTITNQIGGEPDEIAGIVQKVASGDLQITFDQRKAVGIYDYMKQMVNKLTEIVGIVSSGTEQIVSASTELASGNQDLSNRTEQQATALEETSSAIEEMNSSIKSNADNTRTADQLSSDALEKTEDGSKAVGTMIVSMNEISTSSNRIADIIEVINNIAFQTNLLALNASIEAARAGEQGKGFAVVAVEVRKLAKRSDKAASEIAEIIKTSNKKVDEGVDIANKAGDTLTEINGAVKKVTALVGEISAASQEQLSSVSQIDQTLASLDENTQKNAALVEEAASSTEELSAQAQELNSNMRFFKLSRSAESRTLIGNRKEEGVQLINEPVKSEKAITGITPSDSETYEVFSNMGEEDEFAEF